METDNSQSDDFPDTRLFHAFSSSLDSILMFLEFLHHQKIPRHQKSEKKKRKTHLLMLKFHQKIKKTTTRHVSTTKVPGLLPAGHGESTPAPRHAEGDGATPGTGRRVVGFTPWPWPCEPANTMGLRKKTCFFFRDQKKVLKHQKPRI